MRHITKKGLKLIKRFEGFSATPYFCSAGHLTVGYGHLIRKGEIFKIISVQDAEILLRKDVETAEKAVLNLIDVPLTDGQFDALVSFTYNLGYGALKSSTLRKKVNAEDHSAVPAQLNRWVHANGRKLLGLIRRREAEAELYQVNY